MTRIPSSWIVLKFGGTSVATLANWINIAGVAAERCAGGARVLIVHSAVSGVTDRLERLLNAAVGEAYEEELAAIEERHRRLAADLGVPLGEEVERHLDELRELAAGIALVREVSDRTRARVMATGELMATRIGASFLEARGLPVAWVDARTMLRAEERHSASAKASVLSAVCGFAPDAALAAQLARLPAVLVTQGFIASDDAGNTVLLGRGGSDTSAAYLAAKLRAQRLEIWTDVPGMFSANPRSTPTARLLRALHYDEAQEIATSGAKVLHPRCILPVRQQGIPLHVYATQAPHLEGTVLSAEGGEGGAQVKAVCSRKGITLISMESPGMWHEVGFLADAFLVFKQHGLSVDLVSTSETNVTVSLDPAANTLDNSQVAALVADLSHLCRVQVIGPCASVSLVGRNIRAILHQLGGAFEFFEEQKIHLVSQAANDLNFTFVVDEDQGDRLVEQLHELLIRAVPGDKVLGPTWQQLFASAPPGARRAPPWWRARRGELLAALGARESAYVYDLATVRGAARALRAMKSIDRVHYSMKANPHAGILGALRGEGIEFECVARGEIAHLLESCPDVDPGRILYTPNFAPRDEYAWALERGVRVTVDNSYALSAWPELFHGREIFARLDTGVGRGHHTHVRTAGTRSKFGVPIAELPAFEGAARAAGARITGLEAHVGSGVFDVTSWEHTARLLAAAARTLEGVRVIDVGGGLGVPERSDQPGVDLARLDTLLLAVRAEHPGLEVWLEPGRYLVAAAGVLLARVTQLKQKGGVRFVGVATGMNSLIRPALYGSYHEITNLTRIDEPATELVNIVGPICESADVLGHDRLLPVTEEGDILLIANAGAYGHAMSSHYNLRAPAAELVL
ncbi:MAG TPA: bifunctional aspartate kinase/diaminopimelate decarboxylase [Steroidobacteraceae bacterium]|jgi:diaminopimelate decarboxylase/aspartate kinase|nr:bifunctional aspartate kinase/diaminopimelate decarboxylase [Steroidobacteraceae bacterium]